MVEHADGNGTPMGSNASFNCINPTVNHLTAVASFARKACVLLMDSLTPLSLHNIFEGYPFMRLIYD